MDKQFEPHGISFVWVENKDRKNQHKHDGVTFEQAAEAFFDPFLKVVDASAEDEARDAIIGMDTSWNLLFVVHIAFEENLIRIISARKAVREDRRTYEN